MVFANEGFFEAIENWPDWDLNSQPPNIYIYTDRWTCNNQMQKCTSIFQGEE